MKLQSLKCSVFSSIFSIIINYVKKYTFIGQIKIKYIYTLYNCKCAFV